MENILIIDDDKEMRSLLSDIVTLEGHKAFVFDNGEQALKKIKNISPAAVLLDIRLPGMDGLATLKEIKNINKNIVVIMITGYGEIKDAVQAIKIGALDYITKPLRNKEIISLINEAIMLRQHSDGSDNISQREREVLHWLKEGKSSRDISMILNISERTVNFHINNIMQKFDAVSRVQAVAIAVSKGLV